MVGLLAIIKSTCNNPVHLMALRGEKKIINRVLRTRGQVNGIKLSEIGNKVTTVFATPPPVRRDSAGIGSVFIDVLFGAVVAKALDLSTASGGVPDVGRAQIGLAMIVTITSWIGYHNSSSRNAYRIMFFNLPLLQFVIEILHLLIYWLLVTTSAQWQGSPRLQVNGSAIPESALVAVVFVLFCAWDFTALAMRKSSKYEDIKIENDRPRRRLVTQLHTALFAMLAIVIGLTGPSGAWTLAMAVILTVLVVSHRWLQNIVQLAADREPSHP